MTVLVVIHPFGRHRRGDRITAAAEIASVLAGDNRAHVVRADHAAVKPAPAEPAAPPSA
jgi:hypothetical protein